MKNQLHLQADQRRGLLRKLLLFGIVWAQFCYFALLRGNLDLIPDWQSVELTFNYSDFGFIRRGLMGELVIRLAALFKKEYAFGFISHFELFSVLLFTAAALAGFYYFTKKVEPRNKDTLFYCSLAFVCFGGVSFYYLDWAEPDIYMIVLTLVSVTCAIEGKLLFLIPINCALCVMIHEGYPMMFFFIVMAILFYRWMSADKPLVNRYSVVLIISGLITSALFIYFFFFSSCREGMTLDEVERRAIELTTVSQRKNIEYVLFNGDGGLGAYWIEGKPTGFFYRSIVNSAVVHLLYAPVIWPVWRLQLRTIKAAEAVQERLKYAVCFGGFAFVIPLFLTQTDTGRWLHEFFWYEFLITAFLLAVRDERFSAELRRLLQSRTHPWFLLLPYFVLNLDMEKEWMYHASYAISDTLIRFLMILKVYPL